MKNRSVFGSFNDTNVNKVYTVFLELSLLVVSFSWEKRNDRSNSMEFRIYFGELLNKQEYWMCLDQISVSEELVKELR